MSVVLITGSAGLIGSEAVNRFCALGHTVVGIDNDMRQLFFGADASNAWNRKQLLNLYPSQYRHYDIDIRDKTAIDGVFRTYGQDILLVIHAAAQPSHDWAVREPLTDFGVNATGTLHVLEAVHRFCPGAVLIFTSTNKVYGDTPNRLPLMEIETRWEVAETHSFHRYGIDETMSIDTSTHSIFGASKLAADIMVQEYGRYFGMKTGVFRCGCLSGPNHAGTQLHGFLSYLMKCVCVNAPYTVLGYKGKQVRDTIHSADLMDAFVEFFRAPRCGEVYNIGGSRQNHCSVIEAIKMCERIAGRKLNWTYSETNRIGDHIWYVSDIRKFQSHYPRWRQRYDLPTLLVEIYKRNAQRWEKNGKDDKG